jgi:hypothetical protein
MMPESLMIAFSLAQTLPKMSLSRQCLSIIFPHPFTKLYVVINFARIVSLPQIKVFDIIFSIRKL